MSEQMLGQSSEAAAGAAPGRTTVRELLAALRHVLAAETDRTRTQRAAILAFVIRIASAGIAYLSQVVLARWMGSFEYGAYVFVWVWVLVLGGLSNFGLNVAMMRFVPEYREKGRHDLLHGLLLGGRIVAVVGGTVVAGLGLAWLHFFGHLIAHHYVLPAYLALVCIPLFVLSDVQDGIGRAHQWILTGLLPPYVLRPLLLLAAMIGAHEIDLPMTATTAAGAAIIATWGAGMVQTLALSRRLRSEAKAPPRRAYDFRTWLAVSLPILMITGADLVIQNIDVVVISMHMTPRDVGIYFAGLKTMSLIAFVHYAVASAWSKEFSALHARGDGPELARSVREAVKWTFWPSLVGAAVILALGKPLLWLFGPEFTAAYGPMFVLAIGLLLKSAVGPAEFLLNMAGEQVRCGAVLLGTAALDIVLNLLLVPRYGLWGGAAATAISLALASLLFAALVRRRLGIDMPVWSRWPARP
jgi:O-antigen/teichoic acid export membrane protein